MVSFIKTSHSFLLLSLLTHQIHLVISPLSECEGGGSFYVLCSLWSLLIHFVIVTSCGLSWLLGHFSTRLSLVAHSVHLKYSSFLSFFHSIIWVFFSNTILQEPIVTHYNCTSYKALIVAFMLLCLYSLCVRSWCVSMEGGEQRGGLVLIQKNGFVFLGSTEKGFVLYGMKSTFFLFLQSLI